MAIYLLQTYSSQSKSCSCCCSSCEDLGYVTNCTPNQGSAGSSGGDGYYISASTPGSAVVTCQPISVPCPQNPDYQLNCYNKITTPFVPPSPPSSPTPSDLDPSCAQCQGSIDGINIAPFTFLSSPGAIQACINASNLPNPFVEGNITFHCNGLCFTCS